MKRTIQGVPRQRQSGAALIVALVLLVIITITAVSMMSTTRMELVMAGNTQFGLHAFQAAQSAIEARLDAGGFTTGAAPAAVTHNYAASGSSATSNVAFVLSTDVPAGGYSLGAGFQAYHFQLNAAATAPRGATSNQTQGFYIVGPGGS